MLKHYFVTNFKKHAEGATGAENAVKLQDWLLYLGQVIPEIAYLEVHLNTYAGPTEADLVMYAEYGRYEDLLTVRNNPQHQEMLAWYDLVAVAASRKDVLFNDSLPLRPCLPDC